MNTNDHPIIQKFRNLGINLDHFSGCNTNTVFLTETVEKNKQWHIDNPCNCGIKEEEQRLEAFLLEVDKQAREEEREKINMSFKNLHCLCSEEGKYCKGLSIELSDLQHQERKGENTI